MSQISSLPYMQPLAISQPIVLDGSMSYYEFLNKLYDAIQNQVIPAVNSYDSQITEWSNKWTQHNTQITTLQSAVSGHTFSIQNLSTRMSEAEEDITTVEGEIATTNANVTALSTTVTGHTSSINALNGRLDSDESLLSSLSTLFNKYNKWTHKAKVTPFMTVATFFENKEYETNIADSSIVLIIPLTSAGTVDITLDCQEGSQYDVTFSFASANTAKVQIDFLPIDYELDAAYASFQWIKLVQSSSTPGGTTKSIMPNYHYTLRVSGAEDASPIKWYIKGKLATVL